MSTTLLTSMVRGARRVRLFFSGPLAMGAFSPNLYTVADSALSGPSPITVEAAFAIATDANAVELSVSADFVAGAAYTITGTSVPCADASLFTGSIQNEVAAPVLTPPNVEPAVSDLDLVLYSRDLAWDGQDFLEDATGDLLTTSGQPNWQAAMTRRMISSGLLWDAPYGAGADSYVDAPDIYQRPLAGALLAQARLDDRTSQASISVEPAPGDADGWVFAMSIQGRDGLQPITISVPSPSDL